MTINKIRLGAEPDPLHIGCGDVGQLLVAKSFFRREHKDDVQSCLGGALIKLEQILEAPGLILLGELVGVLEEIAGIDAFSLFLP